MKMIGKMTIDRIRRRVLGMPKIPLESIWNDHLEGRHDKLCGVGPAWWSGGSRPACAKCEDYENRIVLYDDGYPFTKTLALITEIDNLDCTEIEYDVWKR